ncbi:MAG: FAD-binding protein, partial [Candidatus Omnitrophica bacterium]|nr:FAD-binding protein [Candidatus Omnitrophota bacterium]
KGMVLYTEQTIIPDFLEARVGHDQHIATTLRHVKVENSVPIVVKMPVLLEVLSAMHDVRRSLEDNDQLPAYAATGVTFVDESIKSLVLNQWPANAQSEEEFISRNYTGYLDRTLKHEGAHLLNDEYMEILPYALEMAQTPYGWMRWMNIIKYKFTAGVKDARHVLSSDYYINTFLPDIIHRHEDDLGNLSPSMVRKALSGDEEGLINIIPLIPEKTYREEAQDLFDGLMSDDSPRDDGSDGGDLFKDDQMAVTVSTLSRVSDYLRKYGKTGAVLYLDIDDTIVTQVCEYPSSSFPRKRYYMIMDSIRHNIESNRKIKSAAEFRPWMREQEDWLMHEVVREFIAVEKIGLRLGVYRAVEGIEELAAVAGEKNMKIIAVTNRFEEMKENTVEILKSIGFDISPENIRFCGYGRGVKARALAEEFETNGIHTAAYFIDDSSFCIDEAKQFLADNHHVPLKVIHFEKRPVSRNPFEFYIEKLRARDTWNGEISDLDEWELLFINAIMKIAEEESRDERLRLMRNIVDIIDEKGLESRDFVVRTYVYQYLYELLEDLLDVEKLVIHPFESGHIPESLQMYMRIVFPLNHQTASAMYTDGRLALTVPPGSAFYRKYGAQAQFTIHESNLYLFMEEALKSILKKRPHIILLPDSGARPFKGVLERFIRSNGLHTKVLLLPVSFYDSGDTREDIYHRLYIGKLYHETQGDMKAIKRYLLKHSIFEDLWEDKPALYQTALFYSRFFPITGDTKVMVFDDNVGSGTVVFALRDILERFGMDLANFSFSAALLLGRRADAYLDAFSAFISGHVSWTYWPPKIAIYPSWEKDYELRGIILRKKGEHLMSENTGFFNSWAGEFQKRAGEIFMKDWEFYNGSSLFKEAVRLLEDASMEESIREKSKELLAWVWENEPELFMHKLRALRIEDKIRIVMLLDIHAILPVKLNGREWKNIFDFVEYHRMKAEMLSNLIRSDISRDAPVSAEDIISRWLSPEQFLNYSILGKIYFGGKEPSISRNIIREYRDIVNSAPLSVKNIMKLLLERRMFDLRLDKSLVSAVGEFTLVDFKDVSIGRNLSTITIQAQNKEERSFILRNRWGSLLSLEREQIYSKAQEIVLGVDTNGGSYLVRRNGKNYPNGSDILMQAVLKGRSGSLQISEFLEAPEKHQLELKEIFFSSLPHFVLENILGCNDHGFRNKYIVIENGHVLNNAAFDVAYLLEYINYDWILEDVRQGVTEINLLEMLDEFQNPGTRLEFMGIIVKEYLRIWEYVKNNAQEIENLIIEYYPDTESAQAIEVLKKRLDAGPETFLSEILWAFLFGRRARGVYKDHLRVALEKNGENATEKVLRGFNEITNSGISVERLHKYAYGSREPERRSEVLQAFRGVLSPEITRADRRYDGRLNMDIVNSLIEKLVLASAGDRVVPDKEIRQEIEKLRIESRFIIEKSGLPLPKNSDGGNIFSALSPEIERYVGDTAVNGAREISKDVEFVSGGRRARWFVLPSLGSRAPPLFVHTGIVDNEIRIYFSESIYYLSQAILSPEENTCFLKAAAVFAAYKEELSVRNNDPRKVSLQAYQRFLTELQTYPETAKIKISKLSQVILKESDFLVIGGGVAALSSTVYLLQRILQNNRTFTTTVVFKGRDEKTTNTERAQGGLAVPLRKDEKEPVPGEEKDYAAKQVRDTLLVGELLSDPDATIELISSFADRIRDSISWGADFDRGPSGKLSLGKEGGGSNVHRIVKAGGAQAGREIQRTLIRTFNHFAEQARAQGHSVNLDRNVFILDLVRKNNGSCLGAFGVDLVTGEYIVYVSRAVNMATGGLGNIYARTTNGEDATGDGYAMVLRAGGELANMEFVQIHP